MVGYGQKLAALDLGASRENLRMWIKTVSGKTQELYKQRIK